MLTHAQRRWFDRLENWLGKIDDRMAEYPLTVTIGIIVAVAVGLSALAIFAGCAQ